MNGVSAATRCFKLSIRWLPRWVKIASDGEAVDRIFAGL